jgi:myosin I
MKIEFDQTFHMQGCEIVNYLLEKTRVVHQSKDERNYHIFYQLLSTTNAKYRSQFNLRSISDYNYLNQSGCETIPGVNDTEEFNEVLSAMETLQFPTETMDEVFQVLALVLNLGNLQFIDGSAASSTGEASAILSRSSQETLVLCAEFLGIESPILLHSLTEKVIQMGRNSMVSIKLNRVQAEDGRDNLSKTVYSNLFDWIIRWVNTTLKTTDKTYFSIGILDIFGFEG